MPYFKQDVAPIPNWLSLVDVLYQELAAPSQLADAPAIFEEEVPATRFVHVLVIWDQFADVPQERRGALILDAYKRADEARMYRIRFAIGLTRDEAVRGGYLPYKVEPTYRKNVGVDPRLVRQAMLKCGAWETSAGNLQLRFPYRWLAEKSLQELQAQFGETSFALAEEIGSVGSWAQPPTEKVG